MDEKQYAEIMAQLAANAKEHESYNRRLSEHDEAISKQNEILIVLERLTGSLSALNTTVKRVENTVNSVDSRVAALEREPADKWKKRGFEVLKWAVIGILAFAAGTFFAK